MAHGAALLEDSTAQDLGVIQGHIGIGVAVRLLGRSRQRKHDEHTQDNQHSDSHSCPPPNTGFLKELQIDLGEVRNTPIGMYSHTVIHLSLHESRHRSGELKKE